MSSFLCFICHSTVNEEINEDTREKYRDVVGMNLCPDSQLCYICCHVLNKLSLFRSICLKRSLEYPVLFSYVSNQVYSLIRESDLCPNPPRNSCRHICEKGTINLHRSNLEVHVLCPDDCIQYHHVDESYSFSYSNDFNDETSYNNDNEYVKFADNNDFNDNFNSCQYQTINDRSNDDIINDKNDLEIETDRGINESNEGNLNINEAIANDIDVTYNNIGHDDNDDRIDEIVGNSDIVDDEIVETNDVVETNEIIDDNLNNDDVEKLTRVRKAKKSNKTKKKCFKKIILSVEEQKAALEANRREKKYIEAEFKCYNCAIGFLFKDTYQAHMMRHEESNGEYQCGTCTLRFASAALLRAHAAGHRERLVCACGAGLTPRAARAHACRRRAGSVACQFCGNLFKDPSGLQQHLRRVHTSKAGGRLLSCMVCGESYKNQAALRTHMIKHIKRKFHCDKCPATYSSPYTLTQHKRTHESGGQLHYCTTCGVGYSTKKSLLAHKRNTMNHQQTLFECPICNRLCPTERSLASHIQTVHSTTKEYACPQCPARYTSRKSLVRHVGTHNGKVEIKMAVCHLCGNSFKGNNKLNRHLREVCEKTKLEEEITDMYY